MGGPDRLHRGKQSGLGADDLTRARDVGAMTPGKTTLVQQTLVGNPYIDHGAPCDGKDATVPGCFMEDWQRARFLADLRSRNHIALSNYKFAIAELRVDTLLKKPDDMHWMLALALEVAANHILGSVVTVLKYVRSAKAAGLVQLGADASADTPAVASLAANLTEKQIESFTKAGFDPAKKGTLKAIQNEANERTEQSDTLAYLSTLQTRCDAAFSRFFDLAAAGCNDAELLVVCEGMSVERHSIGAYKQALTAKLERYRKSGVPAIGSTDVLKRSPGRSGVIPEDRRVIWVVYPNGQKALWYQVQSGPLANKLGMMDHTKHRNAQPGPRTFGTALDGEITRDRLVPEEFVDVALARSEQVWGAVETTYVTPSLLGDLPMRVPSPGPGRSAGQPLPRLDLTSSSCTAP